MTPTTRTPRRKVSVPDVERAGHTPLTPGTAGASVAKRGATATGTTGTPKLKARVNVSEIVDPSSASFRGSTSASGSGTGTPRLRKTPSTASGLSASGLSGLSANGGGNGNGEMPLYVARSRSPVSSSSRSSAGIGPGTPTNTTLRAKPIVAKGSRIGTPVTGSGAGTPGGATHVGVGVAVGAGAGATPTPVRRPGSMDAPTGSAEFIPQPTNRSPTRPAANLGHRSTGSIGSVARLKPAADIVPPSSGTSSGNGSGARATPPPAKVHVRRSSSTHASISSAPIPPAGRVRPATTSVTPAGSSTPHGQHTPHSTLAAVTPSGANQTQIQTQALPQPQTQTVSASLLSPQTLIPSVAPPTPPQLGLEAPYAPFGSATLTTADSLEQANFNLNLHLNLHDPPVSSNHSSPVRAPLPLDPSPLRAHFPHLNLQHHPTASCPTSPVPRDMPTSPTHTHMRRGSRPPLPWHPHSTAPRAAVTPDSPELRTVALPVMTPTRSPELPDAHLVPSSAPFFTRMRSFSGYRSGSDDGHGDEDEQADEEQVDDELGEHEHDNEHDRLSGSTAGYDSYDDEHRDNDASPTMVDPDVRSDEEMAKVERKIADLEISNASLLAVNRTLEATKAKQRSEIVKLRRQLRESHLGLRPAPSFSVPISVTASSEAAGSAPGTDLSLARVLSDEEVYGDDEMDDPELDARWDRLASLVGVMRRRGEDAVAHGNEEMKPAGSRVLGWLEVEALNKAADEGEGISPSPSPGPAGPDDEIASELLSGAPSEGEAEER